MFDSNLVQNVFFYQTGGSTFCWALWIIINEVVFQRSKSKYILGKRTSSGAGPSLEEERSILQGGCLWIETSALEFMNKTGWNVLKRIEN
jgi:hypothetical protein